MKICVALHSVMDFGGIINHTEQLIGGLKDLGHEVNFLEYSWKNTIPKGQNKSGSMLVGPSGIPYNQKSGWNFPAENRRFYSGLTTLADQSELNSYDLVIWTVPVPSKNKQNFGNDVWPELYDLKTKQVAFSHDGNAQRGYPHIIHIADRLSALFCVHHCALSTADFIPTLRTLLVNPQYEPVRPLLAWQSKKPGFVNMQTFKAWKRVHELVGAIRYLPPKKEHEFRHVAGKGIEYQYLTSVEKCKDAYFHEDGERFWEAALENGMVYSDYWDENEVNAILQNARILVDPSWSDRYSGRGGHYNRVAVDAMIRGAIPVAREKGMGNELFVADDHYISIPEDADHKQYAEILESSWSMSANQADAYREAARELLPQFDRKVVAQKLLDFTFHPDMMIADFGEPETSDEERANSILEDHFGILT